MYLGVELGAQGAGLQKGLRKVHAALINVHASRHIVQSIGDDMLRFPKRIIEHVLSIGGNAADEGTRLQTGVDGASLIHGRH
jgi:hypothetical protein